MVPLLTNLTPGGFRDGLLENGKISFSGIVGICDILRFSEFHLDLYWGFHKWGTPKINGLCLENAI